MNIDWGIQLSPESDFAVTLSGDFIAQRLVSGSKNQSELSSD